MPVDSKPDPLILAIERSYHRGPTPDPERLALVLRNVERAAAKERPSGRARWFPWLLAGAVAAAAAAGGWRWHEQRSAPESGTAQGAAPAHGETPPASPLPGGEPEAARPTEVPPTPDTRGSGKGRIIFMQ